MRPRAGWKDRRIRMRMPIMGCAFVWGFVSYCGGRFVSWFTFTLLADLCVE